ncbi:MAG: phage virion morphogenesis protein [Pseudomonadota bacterium]
MAGASIIIEDEELNAALGRVERAGGNTEPLMREITAAMLFSTQRRFERETGPDGRPWQPLSPRTARQRIGRNRRRGTENMLRVSGRLYSSIVGEASSREAVIGTNVTYASVHQEGATINMPARSRTVRLRRSNGRTVFARTSHRRVREVEVSVDAYTVTIPARPFLGFSDEDRATILQIAEGYYQRAIDGGGTP